MDVAVFCARKHGCGSSLGDAALSITVREIRAVSVCHMQLSGAACDNRGMFAIGVAGVSVAGCVRCYVGGGSLLLLILLLWLLLLVVVVVVLLGVIVVDECVCWHC